MPLVEPVLVIKSKDQVEKSAKLNAAVLQKQRQNNSQFLDILGRHNPSLQGALSGRCKECGEVIETHVDAIEAHGTVCNGRPQAEGGAASNSARVATNVPLLPNLPREPSEVRARVTDAEWSLRVELAAAYRVFAMLGWTHLIHTHITVKVPADALLPNARAEDHFLVNPYGLLWHEITASSLVKVLADGGVVDNGSTGYGINPAGFKIHSALHTSARGLRGDIVWTMHTHTPEVVAIASQKRGLLRGFSNYSMDLGEIRYHDFVHAMTKKADVCAQLVADLGPTSKVLLLRNHGCITVGRSVHEAFLLLYQLIEACKVQLLAHIPETGNDDSDLQGVTVVPPDIVDATYRIVQENYTGKPFGQLEWQAMRRQMEALPSNDGYAS